jgi:hypothetical protein
VRHRGFHEPLLLLNCTHNCRRGGVAVSRLVEKAVDVVIEGRGDAWERKIIIKITLY